jgi:hypothetical protein
MRHRLVSILLPLLFFGLFASCTSDAVPETIVPNADLLSLGVDSRSSIESRISDDFPDIVKRIVGPDVLTRHSLTAQERK